MTTATVKKAAEQKPNAAAPQAEQTEQKPAIQTAATLAESVNALKATREGTLEKLRNAREFHTTQITEIDTLLAELGFPVKVEESAAAVTAPTRRGAPRAGRETTIAGAVEQLLLKHKGGLSRADLTGKMASEMGYEIGDAPDAAKKFANNVYTGGVNKLVTEGKVITVGQRPNTIYKHVNHATKDEQAAFKKSKG